MYKVNSFDYSWESDLAVCASERGLWVNNLYKLKKNMWLFHDSKGFDYLFLLKILLIQIL